MKLVTRMTIMVDSNSELLSLEDTLIEYQEAEEYSLQWSINDVAEGYEVEIMADDDIRSLISKL